MLADRNWGALAKHLYVGGLVPFPGIFAKSFLSVFLSVSRIDEPRKNNKT